MQTRWDYEGRRAIVTGAASGMGRATAAGLVAAGAEVHALDIKPVEVEGIASAQIADLSDSSSIAAALDGIDEPVDSLFNCAGLPHTFPPLQIMEVSWLGTRELTEAVLDRMAQGASIVTIASIGGLGWQSRLPQIQELLATPNRKDARAWLADHPDVVGDGYTLAKQSVIVYAMARATELAGRGIRINCTSPGDTLTGMRKDFIDHFGKEMWEKLPRPLGRASEPEEQAEVLLFLNSGSASYITGANLIVDAAATIPASMALPTDGNA